MSGFSCVDLRWFALVGNLFIDMSDYLRCVFELGIGIEVLGVGLGLLIDVYF